MEKHERNSKGTLKKYSIAFIILLIANCAIFITGLTLLIIATTSANTQTDCSDSKPNLFLFENIEIEAGNVIYNVNNKSFKFFKSNKDKTPVLQGKLGLKIDIDNTGFIDVDGQTYNMKANFITKLPSYLVSNTKLHVKTEIIEKSDYRITCNHYDWSFDERLKNVNQEFEDCFELDDAYWYGGSESYFEQFWPINNQTHLLYKPYLTGLFGISSSVLERYWFSSKGVAIIVDQAIPLFVKMNKTNICFLAASKYPYSEKQILKLSYDICNIQYDPSYDIYLRSLHLEMMKRYFAFPSDIPDTLMFKSPIWSTWATFKRNINDSVVLNYAQEILENNYTHSQLEIDDKWAPAYGDFVFDTTKFPNATKMIKDLNALGYRTTLWMHPFANFDSATFIDKAFKFYWARAPDGEHPAFTAWWNGLAAGILDTTFPNATEWFVSELENMRSVYGIDSFKFDAGEVEWLPRLGFWLYNDTFSPDQYSMEYARMAHKLGNMIEVRTGCQTQDLPIFVRMIDKDSRWGFDNGLKSVVTTALVMSILGYPFVLPDMIGGNAYGATNSTDSFAADLSVTVYPDYELFVRWAQVTAFMPSMQYSIPPWHYNNKTDVKVNEICRKALEIHETLVYPELLVAAQRAVDYGEPILRPMWWIDSNDKTNLIIDDQFFVGEKFLVAPVLDEGAVKRDIYLPKGKWQDGNNSTSILQGPIWLRNYPAGIDVIPFFIAMNN